MVVFNGTVKIRVLEAVELRPTEWSCRLSIAGQKITQLDPYVNVDVDEYHVLQTTTKPKTCSPRWDEEGSAEVHSGQNIGFSVFHDAAIPPDDFVANCRIPFEDLVGKTQHDVWVSRVPLAIVLYSTALMTNLVYLSVRLEILVIV